MPEYCTLYKNTMINNITDNIFTLNVEPCRKPRMTRSDRWKKRPATTKYWNFKDAVSQQYTGKLPPNLDITFYISMPKSWSNKKRLEQNGKPHQQTPDIDNLIKALFDSLTEDDSYIYKVTASKYWSEKGYIEIRQQKDYNIKQKELF